MDLESSQAKRCHTACGFLIHDQKILLVLHKKLHLWLAPGGHVNNDELPHQAAVREVQEETGIAVKVISAHLMLQGNNSQYLPLPFSINLHWINHGSCEQHWVMAYLVKPVNSVNFKQNTEETDDIRWFAESEIDALDTTPDIKQEIHLAFSLTSNKS